MFTACAGGDLLRLVGKPVVAVEFFRDGSLQLGVAGGRRVLGLSLVQRALGSFLDKRGSVEIGFTSAETNHVDPSLAQRGCLGGDSQRNRFRNQPDTVGKGKHRYLQKRGES